MNPSANFYRKDVAQSPQHRDAHPDHACTRCVASAGDMVCRSPFRGTGRLVFGTHLGGQHSALREFAVQAGLVGGAAGDHLCGWGVFCIAAVRETWADRVVYDCFQYLFATIRNSMAATRWEYTLSFRLMSRWTRHDLEILRAYSYNGRRIATESAGSATWDLWRYLPPLRIMNGFCL